MKIKKKIYKNNISLEIKNNLFKKKLIKILDSFNLERCLLSLYGVEVIKSISSKDFLFLKKCNGSDKISFYGEIKRDDLIQLLNSEELFFDELTIEECFTDFDNFVKLSENKDSFFPIKRKNNYEQSNFYLNFNPYKNSYFEVIYNKDIYGDIDLFD
ncbi:MAG: hypothetical protein IJS58_07450 [Bacilli bacterium]|nr:hypothetical protein [Bacilli bacterium]